MRAGKRIGAGVGPLLAAAVLGWAACAQGQAVPGPKVFVLGVWTQSVGQMDAWKARGVNTMVQVPQGNDIAAWSRAADQRGLRQIRQPGPDLAADLNDAGLLAWATNDEPSNLKGQTFDYGGVAQDPADVARQAAPWRAAAQAAGKAMPIWTNHVGPHISPNWAQKNPLIQDYMRGPISDWLAADSYPIQDGKPMVIATNDGYASTVQGVIIDRQRAWSGGKPVMAFIGVSAFRPTAAVPTPDQFRAMAWSSVIHGAVGIIYFPVRLQPAWAFDATPPALASAITAFDRRISELDGVLVDTRVGGRRPFRLWRSAGDGAVPAPEQLPYPFEATEIATDKGPFRIVLNLSDQPRTFARAQWGVASSLFQPYEVRMGYGAALESGP